MVKKTDEEWAKALTPEQFHVLRKHGTERAGTSPLNSREATRHVSLRRLRTAALFIGHQIRERNRVAELFQAARRRRRHDDRRQPIHDAEPKCTALHAAAILGTCFPMDRARPVCATA